MTDEINQIHLRQKSKKKSVLFMLTNVYEIAQYLNDLVESMHADEMNAKRNCVNGNSI